MNNATTIEPTAASPLPAGVLTGRNEPETDGAPVSKPPTDLPTTPQEDYAVQLTEEEWREQDRLMEEYADAIIRDSEEADEILPKLVWPAFILKATKKLHGADFIRKKGYNTVDADLVYGPGWLDVDDGGPEIKRRLL